MIASALLASVLLTEPPPSSTAAETFTEGELVVATIEHGARAAKRRRQWRASLGISLGTLQAGMGVYGLASPRFDTVMRRSAVARLLLGGAGVSLGLYGIIRPSAMERLQASPELARVAASPSDEVAVEQLRRRWSDLARHAQLWRYLSGGGYILGGLGLTAVGSVYHFHRAAERSSTESLWSFSSIGTGVGLVLVGSLDITIHSHIEQTYETFSDVFGWPTYRRSDRPARGARLRVQPMWGGVLVRGSF